MLELSCSIWSVKLTNTYIKESNTQKEVSTHENSGVWIW